MFVDFTHLFMNDDLKMRRVPQNLPFEILGYLNDFVDKAESLI